MEQNTRGDSGADQDVHLSADDLAGVVEALTGERVTLDPHRRDPHRTSKPGPRGGRRVDPLQVLDPDRSGDLYPGDSPVGGMPEASSGVVAGVHLHPVTGRSHRTPGCSSPVGDCSVNGLSDRSSRRNSSRS
ncbi:hypothetical protein ACFWAY_36130 [Rhodococcus sp. NPDC059968]|uniref:hypothetical protein n=1 Tax=Rhodococcus sp. NPDC059968 TaxID=3347017 RepID=UPI00366E7C68